MAGRGGFGRGGGGGRGGGRGGFGGGSSQNGSSMGRGRNDVVSAQPPVTFPPLTKLPDPLIIGPALQELVDTTFQREREMKRSVFCLESRPVKQDIERYSDRYLRNDEKPSIRNCITGDAWLAFPLEFKPTEKRKKDSTNGVAKAKKPRMALADILGSLEKIDAGAEVARNDVVEGKEDEEDEEDEEEDKANALGGLGENEEEAEEEELDDYEQNYAAEDYDALGSDSGGDDY